jgi:stearoyl-CoA desaturase (Delta-9 desaturase)
MNFEKILPTIRLVLDGTSLGFSTNQKIILVFMMCFLSTLATSIYLHRAKTHRAVKLHKVIEHLFQFILWINTGVQTALWVMVHEHHHRKSDKLGDLHSPKSHLRLLGLNISGPLVSFLVYFHLYRRQSEDIEDRLWNKSRSEDKFTQIVYHDLSIFGPIILFIGYVFLFGGSALWMWAIQFMYLPIVSGFVINGLGHMNDHFDEKTKDFSKNLLAFYEKMPKVLRQIFSVPIGLFMNILTGGEWRHHDHHRWAGSARITHRSGQFDIGFVFIYILYFFNLAEHVSFYSHTHQKRKTLGRL